METSNLNVTKVVPFAINQSSNSSGFEIGKNFADSKWNWVARAVIGFQMESESDGDPNDENASSDSGQTRWYSLSQTTSPSVVWIEQIRESFPWLESSVPAELTKGRENFDTELNLTIVHEIGHQPTNSYNAAPWISSDHQEQGIMSDGGNNGGDIDFSAESILRFRSTAQWTKYDF